MLKIFKKLLFAMLAVFIIPFSSCTGNAAPVINETGNGTASGNDEVSGGLMFPPDEVPAEINAYFITDEFAVYPDFSAVSEYERLSRDQQKIYRVIAEMFSRQETGRIWSFDPVNIHDYKTAYNLCAAGFNAVPEFFGAIAYVKSDTYEEDQTITGLYLEYQPDSDKFGAIREKSAEILSEIEHDGTAEGTAYAIAEWLVNNTIYYDDYPEGIGECDSVYGALINGRAICYGYAKAYDYLCKRAGLETVYITGEKPEWVHAWNMIKLGGVWYHIDVTWMHPDYIYKYFLNTDEVAYQNHYNPCYYIDSFSGLPVIPENDR